ncbi:MAG: hypothetical protein JRG94_05235, partial [Deltaproteobacteria bacterium]|nr:hypothetical protein [Deltaproteobacteria bacterium]
MTHALKLLFVLSALATLVVSGSISHAKSDSTSAESAPEVNALFSPASAFPLDENSDPAAVRIEELRAQLAAQNLELLAMQRDAETARGEDAQALWSRSIELRLDAAVALAEWVDNVESLAANDADVSKYQGQLKTLLPG